jgi:hypothetical protein
MCAIDLLPDQVDAAQVVMRIRNERNLLCWFSALRHLLTQVTFHPSRSDQYQQSFNTPL